MDTETSTPTSILLPPTSNNLGSSANSILPNTHSTKQTLLSSSMVELEEENITNNKDDFIDPDSHLEPLKCTSPNGEIKKKKNGTNLQPSIDIHIVSDDKNDLMKDKRIKELTNDSQASEPEYSTDEMSDISLPETNFKNSDEEELYDGDNKNVSLTTSLEDKEPLQIDTDATLEEENADENIQQNLDEPEINKKSMEDDDLENDKKEDNLVDEIQNLEEQKKEDPENGEIENNEKPFDGDNYENNTNDDNVVVNSENNNISRKMVDLAQSQVKSSYDYVDRLSHQRISKTVNSLVEEINDSLNTIKEDDNVHNIIDSLSVKIEFFIENLQTRKETLKDFNSLNILKDRLADLNQLKERSLVQPNQQALWSWVSGFTSYIKDTTLSVTHKTLDYGATWIPRRNNGSIDNPENTENHSDSEENELVSFDPDYSKDNVLLDVIIGEAPN